jgi:SNF2 family DNA or RNA helicase
LVLSAMDYEWSEQQRDKGVKKAIWPGSKYAWQLWKSGLLDDVKKSPKLEQVVADIIEILDGNPDAKIILFSFYKDMLEIIQDAVPQYRSVQFHGELSPTERAAAKVEFQTDKDCRIFLASDAGRYGVDLPEANYLINYDLPWSAGAFKQGNARHVRAGSKHANVYVRSYLIRGSVEVRQYALVGFKGKIGSAILDNVGADRFGRLENSIDSLTTWLEERSV